MLSAQLQLSLRCTHLPSEWKSKLVMVFSEAQLTRTLMTPFSCRNYSWIQRLRIEETTTAFDRQRCEEQGFLFFEANDGR
jgi:hypothetical protein